MNKITIIGAGKTGRGFLARLLNSLDNEITFIDKNQALVDELNSKKSFEIEFFGNVRKKVVISNYQAYTWEMAKIDADLILVSVGGTNLIDVGNRLKNKVFKGQRIIVCENAKNPAKTLYDAIGVDGIKVSESTVFCTTIEKEGLDIYSENYPYLQFDGQPMKDNLPDLENLKPIFGFENFLTRKLYTYNSASCIIAYLGFEKGYTSYSDAANDKEILSLLDYNYKLANKAMCLEFGYDEKDQKEFAELSRKKFTDKSIIDTVERNAREPHRKICANERIVGPMLLLDKYGLDTSVLEKTLCAAIKYDSLNETKWKEIKSSFSVEQILTEICGLDKNSAIAQRILKKME